MMGTMVTSIDRCKNGIAGGENCPKHSDGPSEPAKTSPPSTSSTSSSSSLLIFSVGKSLLNSVLSCAFWEPTGYWQVGLVWYFPDKVVPRQDSTRPIQNQKGRLGPKVYEANRTQPSQFQCKLGSPLRFFAKCDFQEAESESRQIQAHLINWVERNRPDSVSMPPTLWLL